MKIAVFALLLLHVVIHSYAFAPIAPLVSRRIVLPATTMSASESSDVMTVPDQRQDDQMEVFENDGNFSWMIPFMGMMGMDDGKLLKYGVLTADPSDEGRESSSPEEAAAALQEAMEMMTNIGKEERQRRDQVGNILIPLTTGYAVVAALLLDDGTIFGRLARLDRKSVV